MSKTKRLKVAKAPKQPKTKEGPGYARRLFANKVIDKKEYRRRLGA